MTIRGALFAFLFSFLGAANICSAQTGVTGDEILIGQTGVFSGPVAEPALQYREGARLYFDGVNAKGGVGGRKIKLVSYDDKFDPKLAAENVKKLLNEDKVFALFGLTGAGGIVASMPQIVEHRVPVVGAVSGADALRSAKMNLIFHTRASYTDEVAKMVEHLKTVGIGAIAVVYQDDPFGKLGLKSAQVAFERHHVKPVIEAPIDMTKLDSVGDTTVAQVLKHRPGAIIMITAGKASSRFIASYQKTDSRPQFFGVSVLSSKDLLADLGANARGIVIAQVAPSPRQTSIALSSEYVSAARKANLKDLTSSSIEGYLTAKVLVEGLRRAGKDLTRERLIGALESMDHYSLGGFSIDYSGGKREGSNYVDLSIVNQAGQIMQ